MSKDPNFPAHKFHPVTGELKVCNSAADVPEGWIDTHPNNLPKVDPAAADPAANKAGLEMSREEIMGALDEGGIEYSKNAPTTTLYKKLTEAVKKTLLERGIAYDESFNTKQLLELIPPAE